MSLSEKNNLYLQQKSEIERLKKSVVELEKKLNIRNEFDVQGSVSSFVENYQDNHNGEIKAKELYKMYLNFLVKPLGNKNFYKVMKTHGFNFKRGNGNELFVHGKE